MRHLVGNCHIAIVLNYLYYFRKVGALFLRTKRILVKFFFFQFKLVVILVRSLQGNKILNVLARRHSKRNLLAGNRARVFPGVV